MHALLRCLVLVHMAVFGVKDNFDIINLNPFEIVWGVWVPKIHGNFNLGLLGFLMVCT